MNNITLVGRLTADPDLSAPKGNPIYRFRIAVDRPSEGADFINIVSFGSRGENDAKWLTKGRLVAITGRLHHNTWTDTDGTNRERYEVVAANVSYLPAAVSKPAAPASHPQAGEEPF